MKIKVENLNSQEHICSKPWRPVVCEPSIKFRNGEIQMEVSQFTGEVAKMVCKPRPCQQTYNQMCPMCPNLKGMPGSKEP